MHSNQNDVLTILSEQYRHQVRVARRRMDWLPWGWICIISFGVSTLLTPFIAAFLAQELTLSVVVVALYVAVFAFFAVGLWWMPGFGIRIIGFGVSIFGLILCIAAFLAQELTDGVVVTLCAVVVALCVVLPLCYSGAGAGCLFFWVYLIPLIAAFLIGSPTLSVVVALYVAVFAFFAVGFGYDAVNCLIGGLIKPSPRRLRIVPYFARELGPFGGKTMIAFERGRGLYREIVALDQLAGTLGVKPLSAFGFAYDHYEQEVHWHAAAEGLKTVEALRQAMGAHGLTAPDVAHDLAALASVMRVAADQSVDFSLVLRLHAKDSMQAVCTWEDRQGSFW